MYKMARERCETKRAVHYVPSTIYVYEFLHRVYSIAICSYVPKHLAILCPVQLNNEFVYNN